MHPDDLLSSPDDAATVGDADLILSVRQGDGRAFAQLHHRHYSAALRVALIYANSHHSAEEITAEAFARMYSTLRNDAGPAENFRAYLFTIIRRIAQGVNTKTAPEHLTDDFGPFEHSHLSYRPVGDEFGAGMVGDAFFSLPPRWQTALWYVDVEAIPTAEAATLLGLTPNATAALVYRAREGLRSAFLQQHAVGGVSAGCEPYRGKLAAYVRGTLSKRELTAVAEHLATCTECSAIREDLSHVNVRLRSVLLPLALGGGAATAFLAQTATPAPASAAEHVASHLGRVTRIAVPVAVAALIVGLVSAGIVISARHDVVVDAAAPRQELTAPPTGAAPAPPSSPSASPSPAPTATPAPAPVGGPQPDTAAPIAAPAPASRSDAPVVPAPPAAVPPGPTPKPTPPSPAPVAQVYPVGSAGARSLSVSVDGTADRYTFRVTAPDTVTFGSPSAPSTGALTCTPQAPNRLTCELSGVAGSTARFTLPYATVAAAGAYGSIETSGSLPYQFSTTLPN
ncbi:sigma factor [Leifsonia sp. 21MFCrub1.1]|uniref:sigma factor n=1 Tax=Leifsonia sp. 21MFCrub1.1 TaxID=1798223 RepID=UPI0008928773|nr:sigma-70 family RNA polymerase sigma factor [Leifsonia sp. 21MFCrub1.1]SEA35621.1 DNA-directed RNA polymerase specialized sigma subunit, sigma24 family [Leifsonia sp. 21MFCrub1.1]